MNTLPINEIDGRRLYYTFIAGAKNIMANQSYLNKINVFPVNDGDTGSNMATTVKSVIESIYPHKSYKTTADLIAETTMTNARGNSGIIFAQFLYGMSKESGNQSSITIPQFAESIRNSIPYMYEAVANPVEGTILTVIREWSDFIYTQRNIINDFNQFSTILGQHSEFPKTSQVNEKAFVNLYTQLSASYDSIIAIHLTEKFSGTCFNSQKAAKTVNTEFNKPISVINSKNLSGALGLIVLRAAQAIEAGHSHDEIVNMVSAWIKDAYIFVSVKTLKYMVRGGRVSYVKGLIANLLNINPIVSMDENGSSYIFGKTYSQQSNMEKVMMHLNLICKGREIWNYIVLHVHNPDAAAWYSCNMKDFTGKEPVAVVNISPVIGANAGIGTAAVALMFK